MGQKCSYEIPIDYGLNYLGAALVGAPAIKDCGKKTVKGGNYCRRHTCETNGCLIKKMNKNASYCEVCERRILRENFSGE